MNKENPTPKKPPEGKQKPAEATKDNPVARFLTMCNIVAWKELPVVGGAAVALAIIAILVSIKFISVEFMLILAVATIVKASFQAGVVWQRLQRK